MKRTAAWLVRHALEQIGVRYTFGIPGVHNLELYDELNKSDQIEPVLVTHEMCAAFMADAISRTTDTVGVLAVVPAAGVTHAASGIGEAWLDGIAMLIISGGIRTDLDKRYQLHDMDQRRLLEPITKAVHHVRDYESIVPTIYDAFETATSGEPGPVFVELPANLQLFAGEVSSIPDYHAAPHRMEADEESGLRRAAELLAAAERPGIFVGWGARGASDAVRRIAERLGAPVSTTLQGLSAFPGNHPLHTGMSFGRSAVPAAENAFRDCDAMLAVGTRFAEIATGSYGVTPPENLVHIDINREAIGANYPAAVALHGDAVALVPMLADRIEAMVESRDYAELGQRIADDKEAYRKEWRDHDSKGRVNPERFFSALRDVLDDNAIVVADDGNHTFLTAELMPMHEGGLYLSPTDFNCMGYCIPATIAAKLAHPQRQVVGIVGDGAFLMSCMESATAAARGLGCILFVFNDGELSQIAQAQEIPYNRKTCTVLPPVDYRAFAQAVSCEFVAIEGNDAVADGIRMALEHAGRDRPVIVDLRIDYSKRTRFTKGTVKTNLDRFDTGNKLRFIGRALWRKLTG